MVALITAGLSQKVDLVQGLESLLDLLYEDRFFVLHYKYDNGLVVSPCIIKRQGGALAINGECKILERKDVDLIRSIEVSDIQIGLLIRLVPSLV